MDHPRRETEVAAWAALRKGALIMVGSAGGGDVNLLGALSVWLGPGLTLKVMVVSLLFVILGTTAVVQRAKDAKTGKWYCKILSWKTGPGSRSSTTEDNEDT